MPPPSELAREPSEPMLTKRQQGSSSDDGAAAGSRAAAAETNCGCVKVQTKYVKWATVVAFVTIVVVAVLVFRVQDDFKDLLQWLEKNKQQGAFIFIAIYIVATVFFIPGSLLTLGGGYVFGFGVGVLCVVVGAGIGLCLAFLVGRYVLRDAVAGWVAKNPKFKAIDRAIVEEGWKICLLLRLAPLMPFNAMNYLMSVTQISFPHYALTSVAGIIPGTCLFVYLGSAASDLSELTSGKAGAGGTTKIILLVVTLLVIVAVVVVVVRVAKKALAKAGLGADGDGDNSNNGDADGSGGGENAGLNENQRDYGTANNGADAGDDDEAGDADDAEGKGDVNEVDAE